MPSAHGTKITPSTYYAAKPRPAYARGGPRRMAQTEITRIFEADYRVYGARKIWRQLNARAMPWRAARSSG